MDRIIKFRVYWKNKETGVVKVELCELVVEKTWFTFRPQGQSNVDEIIGIYQFTGLHDKNGKEIYEGDILKCVSPDNDNSDKNIVVEFKNGGYCIEWDSMFYDSSDVTLIYWAIDSDFQFEIIGNIHEHPNLLTNV